MIHSHLVNGWDGLVWLFVGGLILIFGIGLAICISIVLATQRNKESDYMLTMRDDDIE
ncbi:MAG: hypothetical protein FWC69_02360 [Defluviitaleaceae bacterium]|nr:hypothetical protein [Defluviitaleaceae bacterium]